MVAAHQCQPPFPFHGVPCPFRSLLLRPYKAWGRALRLCCSTCLTCASVAAIRARQTEDEHSPPSFEDPELPSLHSAVTRSLYATAEAKLRRPADWLQPSSQRKLAPPRSLRRQAAPVPPVASVVSSLECRSHTRLLVAQASVRLSTAIKPSSDHLNTLPVELRR
jgi:hypothetical protein